MTVVLRGLHEGDGAPLAVCWKELWDLHESWGGYSTDRSPRAFELVADRIERDALARQGDVAFGRHIHLVAEQGGRVVGQVEGWIDRLGTHPKTRMICEIRSLVVLESARGKGIARRLLDRLAVEADVIAREPCVSIAEVLEANPAKRFYTKLGFRPVAWTRRAIPDATLPRVEAVLAGKGVELRIRPTRAGDEGDIARLEARLADRRVRAGDLRFDPPQVVEAAWLEVLRGALSARDPLAPEPFVAVSSFDHVLSAAQFWTQDLETPFAPQKRAIASRLEAFEHDDGDLATQVLARGMLRLARRANASALEFVDLPPPTSPLSLALGAIGVEEWSSMMQRDRIA